MNRFEARLNDRDFERFSRLVYEHCDIKLPPHKRSTHEARLHKRLQAHNLHTFEDYAAIVFIRRDCTEEMVKLIDAVTTTKRISSVSRRI